MRAGRWRVAASAIALGLVAAACSGDDDGAEDDSSGTEEAASLEGLRSAEELEPGLLTAADMPTGWAEGSDQGDDDEGTLCDVEIGSLLGLEVDELPNAERQFEEDPDLGPLFGESIGFVPEGRGPEVLGLVREALDGCEDEFQGEPTVMRGLSYPPVGDESTAFRLTVGDQDSDFTLDFSVVYARVDDLLLVLYAVDPFGDATAVLEEFVVPAIEKAATALL
jgi:hypothetical protein